MFAGEECPSNKHAEHSEHEAIEGEGVFELELVVAHELAALLVVIVKRGDILLFNELFVVRHRVGFPDGGGETVQVLEKPIDEHGEDVSIRGGR